jgi:predicted esterase
MRTIQTTDGTSVTVSDPIGPGVPLVVLLHGLGGSELDMTDPAASRWGPVIRDRNAAVPGPADLGINVFPVAGVDHYEIDPVAAPLRSWRQAFNENGFPTVSYSQVGGPLVAAVAQLIVVATEVLSHPDFAAMPLVFVGHSRGGILARNFLVRAAVNAAFISRVRACITLHSPNQGSAVADAAVTIDGILAALQSTFTGMGVPAAVGALAPIRGIVSSPAYPELRVNSPILSAIAGAEPAGSVEYHTFGGTSTQYSRLRAHAYSPTSAAPIPVPLLPFPLFHWSTFPVQVGAPVDPLSFLPLVPVVAELQATLATLAAGTPEAQHGSGDLLVADARAHLPGSLTRTTNPLTHADALCDGTLQHQVLGIVQRFRAPTVSGQARTSIDPFPVLPRPATYTVRAEDLISGIPLNGTVLVEDTFGNLAHQGPTGVPFAHDFSPRISRVFDPETKQFVAEVFLSTVTVDLPPPYAQMTVDTPLQR